MNWRRFKQWLEVLALERRAAGRLPWLTMLAAILSGVVPRAVWRERMRTCMRCPLYSTVEGKTGRLHLCKSTHPDMLGVGCGCAVNVSALSARPYFYGCYGRDIDSSLGWGAHVWPSRWARVRSIVDFAMRK